MCKSYYFCKSSTRKENMSNIERLSLKAFRDSVKNDERNYLGEDLLVVSDNHALGRTWFSLHAPFRPEIGICVRVLGGTGEYMVNLVPYKIKAGDVLLFPERSLFEVIAVSEDLHIQFFSYKNLTDPFVSSQHFIHVENKRLWERLSDYFFLMEALSKEHNIEAVTAIQNALIAEIKFYEAGLQGKVSNTRNKGRAHVLYDRFISLLNKESKNHRDIAWYASELCITPNRLSTVVKLSSGLTAGQWICRAVVQQAKIYLLHSELSVSEISERMHFDSPASFTRYFKRETGKTPREFKKG